jgi:hypothetical protein
VIWPTPSKLGLVRLCVYPWSRQAPAWPKCEPKSHDAQFGTAFHRAMALAAVMGISPGLLEQVADEHGLTPSERTKLLGCVEAAIFEVLEHRIEEIEYRAAEVSILYDVAADTARVLPEALERDQIPEGHIHGTVDLVERIHGEWVISDWKTGGRSGELDVMSDPQLRTYALMVARAFGAPRVGVVIIHVDEHGVVPDQHMLDGFELHVARAALRADLALVEAGGPPRPGRHCASKYCPIVAECPATLRALAEVQSSVDAQLPMQLLPLDALPEQAARVRVGIRAVEKQLAYYQAALEAWVDANGSVEIAPGVRYGKIERDGNERIDAEQPGAVAAVRELLGEQADLALEVSTSKAAIERAARARAKALGDTAKGAIKRHTDPVLDRLRSIGAIRQGAPSTRYDEVAVKATKKERAA